MGRIQELLISEGFEKIDWDKFDWREDVLKIADTKGFSYDCIRKQKHEFMKPIYSEMDFRLRNMDLRDIWHADYQWVTFHRTKGRHGAALSVEDAKYKELLENEKSKAAKVLANGNL